MEGKPSIFRKEALEHFLQSRRQEGDVLRLAPSWTRWTYWLLMGLLWAAVLFCTWGTVYEYASGPALVRIGERTEVTAPHGGVVATVEVRPGQRVAAGQMLVTLLADEERGNLSRMQREFELHLVRYMRDPSDEAARQSLTALRAERELAEARLEARALRSPVAGVVTDVRTQPAQFLAPGTRVASIMEDASPVLLMAFLPGSYRPFLRPGMPLRVELDGFRYLYRELPIESVGDQIIGPDEVRRYLGPDLAGTVEAKGPLVIVTARMPSQTFSSEGRVFSYFDGMPARAEVAVRDEPLLLTLLPALKALFPHDD